MQFAERCLGKSFLVVVLGADPCDTSCLDDQGDLAVLNA